MPPYNVFTFCQEALVDATPMAQPSFPLGTEPEYQPEVRHRTFQDVSGHTHSPAHEHCWLDLQAPYGHFSPHIFLFRYWPSLGLLQHCHYKALRKVFPWWKDLIRQESRPALWVEIFMGVIRQIKLWQISRNGTFCVVPNLPGHSRDSWLPLFPGTWELIKGKALNISSLLFYWTNFEWNSK